MPCEVPSLLFSDLPSHPVAASAGNQKIYFIAGTMYYRGTGAPELFLASQGVTPLAMTLLAEETTAEWRTTLGLDIGGDVQPHSADLDSFVANASWSGANLTIAGNVTSTGQLAGASLVINGNAQFDTDVTIDGTLTVNTAIVATDITTNNLTVNTLATLQDLVVLNAISAVSLSTSGGIASSAGFTVAAIATITAGSGVPVSAAQDGSIYLRFGAPNGSLYVRQNGVWTLK